MKAHRALLLIALLPGLAIATDLRPYQAVYQATWDVGINMDGELTRTLSRQADGQWQLHSNASALVASIKEHSQLSVVDGQVIPHQYHYRKKVLTKKETDALQFNWDKQQVRNTNSAWQAPLSTGVQDQLSYQLQMQLDLQAGKTGPLHYTLVGKDKIKQYAFNITGQEKIQTPSGQYDTLQVILDRGEDAKRTTRIWFAPSLDYLIVQLTQIEPDGKAYTVKLKSIEYPQ